VHDINNLDQRGIPGMFIASSEFVTAAEAQSAALGFAAPVAYVPHPIQDRTNAEMKEIADQAFDAILAKISHT